MSRVHWPSAARGGERAGAPLRQRAAISCRWSSSTRPSADGDALDWVARAAAGIVLALARSGGCRVLLPGDRVPTALDDTEGWPALHRRLAALEPGGRAAPRSSDPRRGARRAAAPGRAAERGALPPGVVALLAGVRRHDQPLARRVSWNCSPARRGDRRAGGACSAPDAAVGGCRWRVAASLVVARAVCARAPAWPLLAAWVPLSLLLAGVPRGRAAPARARTTRLRSLGDGLSTIATAGGARLFDDPWALAAGLLALGVTWTAAALLTTPRHAAPAGGAARRASGR